MLTCFLRVKQNVVLCKVLSCTLHHLCTSQCISDFLVHLVQCSGRLPQTPPGFICFGATRNQQKNHRPKYFISFEMYFISFSILFYFFPILRVTAILAKCDSRFLQQWFCSVTSPCIFEAIHWSHPSHRANTELLWNFWSQFLESDLKNLARDWQIGNHGGFKKGLPIMCSVLSECQFHHPPPAWSWALHCDNFKA